ncbi:MAG: WYL domain-containing protein [bacterium]
MINKYLHLIPYILKKDVFTIKGLADELKVSPNVIKKIVNTLTQQFGINFIYDKKNKKYILADNEIYNLLNNNFLTLNDILFYILSTLINSSNLKIKRKGLIFYYFIINNNNLLNSLVNENYILSEYVKDFRKDILFNDVPIDFNIFTKIRDAINNKKELRVLVDNFGVFTYINLVPLYLAFLKGEWFLIYISENFQENFEKNFETFTLENKQNPKNQNIEDKIQNEIKKILYNNTQYKIDFIKVSDIKEIFYTGKIFEYNIDGFIEDALPELAFYFKPSPKYKVKIEFSNIFIYDILKVWHPSQNIEIIKKDNINSKIILTLEIANLNSLFMWLSSFGKSAKIIEPELVKTKYIEYLNSIIDINS